MTAFLFKNLSFMNDNIVYQSTITCPNCGHKREETMPTGSCLFFTSVKDVKLSCILCQVIAVYIVVMAQLNALLFNMPTLSRKHICKPTQANAQTKGLQKSFRLSSPSNRLSGRF